MTATERDTLLKKQRELVRLLKGCEPLLVLAAQRFRIIDDFDTAQVFSDTAEAARALIASLTRSTDRRD